MAIKKQLGFAILSGCLVGTSYIPFPPWALLFCLTPLWWVWLQTESPKRIFLLGWITQFTLNVIGFYWIPGLIVEFGKLPWIVGVLGLLAFASFSAIHIPLAGIVWKWIAKKKQLGLGQSLVVLAFLTYLFERTNPQVFPWNFGYVWLWGDIPAYQWADTIGFEGLSFVTFLLNAWVLYLALIVKERRRFRSGVMYFLAFLFLFNITGNWKKAAWSKTDTSDFVLMTQANIGNLEKQWQIYGAKYKDPTIEKFLHLTQSEIDKGNKIDWILWPETAIPEFMDAHYASRPVHKKVIDFIKKNKTPLISGAYSQNPNTRGESNSIFMFDSTGKLLNIYKKSLLLAFGEYMPGSQWFPWLLKIFPEVSDFERGLGPDAFKFLHTDIGPQICYEGLHPWFVSQSVKKGAEILVNVTNDSWFGHTFESFQHLYMTLARSIEFRRPLIRSTNTGISSAMLANGDLVLQSPQKTEWVGVVEIKYLKNAPRTIYNHIGMFLPLIFGILVAGGITLGSRKSRLG